LHKVIVGVLSLDVSQSCSLQFFPDSLGTFEVQSADEYPNDTGNGEEDWRKQFMRCKV